MNILFIGDIVGSRAVSFIEDILAELKESLRVDLVIANAENVAGGLGLTPNYASRLYAAGIDVLTMGNHTWSKRDVVDVLRSDALIARPANGHPNWPGKGFAITHTNDTTIGVINLLGQYGLNPPTSPFIMIKPLLAELRELYPDIVFIVDMHAEATAEKLAMAAFLDGEVAALLGTHTHVQTADEAITDLGMAYITDVGMTGPRDSIIGMSKQSSLRRFVDCLPTRYELASGPCDLNAVYFELDEFGKALAIERIHIEEDDESI